MNSRLLRFAAPLGIVIVVPGGVWGHLDATTRDTALGFGNDSAGRPVLPLHENARIVFVNPDDGSDANSGLTPLLAKATPAAGFAAARHTFGDHVLIAAGSTSAKCLGAIPKRSGFSAQYPTLVSTYDATDPLNDAKYRTGRWYWGSAQGGDSPLNTSSAQDMQWCVFEGGYSVAPETTLAIGQDIPPGIAIFGDATVVGENVWMFYDWSWAGFGAAAQGDWGRGYYRDKNITCDTTSGSNVLTNVLLTHTIPGFGATGGTAPVVGDHLNGFGPDTGIPYDCTVTAYDAVAHTVTLNKNCTATRSAVGANASVPRYKIKHLTFRRTFFGKTGDIAFYAGAVLGLTIEDCFGDRGGFVGKDRQKIPDFVMSANAGVGAGTGTFTLTNAYAGTMTVTGTSVNGSPNVTNVTLLTGDPDYATFPSVTGPGVPGATSVPSYRNTMPANIRKHVFYLATSSPDSIVRRTMISRSSSHGLQQRGGGQCSDNAFILNPINYQVGGGDDYWVAQPYGVNSSGGHNVVCGTSDILATAFELGMAFISAGNVKPDMSQVKNLICNYGGVAGGLYNRLAIKADQFLNPSHFSLSDSIVFNWPNSQGNTLETLQQDPSYVNDQAKFTMTLTNNITGEDPSWNTVGSSSGNVTVAAFGGAGMWPDPYRNEETFAVSKGFANFDEYADWASQHMEVDHALNFNTYMRAGFGV